MPRSLFTRHEPSNPKDPETPKNILEPLLELFQEALEGATKNCPQEEWQQKRRDVYTEKMFNRGYGGQAQEQRFKGFRV